MTAPVSSSVSEISLSIKWLLMVCLAGIGIGATLIFSVLPPVAREMGLSDFQIGLSITVGSIAFTVMAPVWGVASDRLGRKRVMLVGFCGQALSYFLLALVVMGSLSAGGGATWPLWLVFAALCCTRLVFGMFGSGTSPAATAYMSDISTPAERAGAVGIVLAGFGLGTAIGPVLGAFLLPYGPSVPFLGAAAGLAVAFALVALFVREPTRAAPTEATARLKMTDPRILSLCLLQALLFTLIAGLQSTMGFFVQDTYGYDTLGTSRGVGWILLVAAVCILIVQIGVVPRLGWSAARLIWVGMLLLGLGHFITVLQPSFSLALVAAAIMGAGFGLSAPAVPAAATLVVEDHERGSVSGFVIAAQSSGFIFGPFIYSGLYEVLSMDVLWLSVILSGVIAVLGLRHPALKH